MLKQIFFFSENEREEKRKKTSTLMTCCYEDTSAPPIDSKRCHTRKRENKTLWGSKCSAGILDKTHFNQLVP